MAPSAKNTSEVKKTCQLFKQDLSHGISKKATELTWGSFGGKLVWVKEFTGSRYAWNDNEKANRHLSKLATIANYNLPSGHIKHLCIRNIYRSNGC